MLYGESNPLMSPSKDEQSRGTSATGSTGRDQSAQNRQEPSHWCLLVRENGVMEVHTHPIPILGVFVHKIMNDLIQYCIKVIHLCVSYITFKKAILDVTFHQIYQLPDWRLVFLVKNFPVGQRVLVDSSASQSATQGDLKKEEMTRQGELPLVKEVALVSLGYNHSRPYLLVSL